MAGLVSLRFMHWIDLQKLFDELNGRHFQGLLPSIELSYNTRLTTSAGRFIPGKKLKPWASMFKSFMHGDVSRKSNGSRQGNDQMIDGRFSSGRSAHLEVDMGRGEVPPCIEVAHYLLNEATSEALIRDTLGHEMIHFWLWDRGLPYGHTSAFYDKMKEMGVSRFNKHVKRSSFKYFYACPECKSEYPSRRIKRMSACGSCCKRFADGKYDGRYKLVLMESK